MTAYILTRTTNFGPCEVIHKSFVAAETRGSLFNSVGRLCVRGFVVSSVIRDENDDAINVVLVGGGKRYSYSIVEKVVAL